MLSTALPTILTFKKSTNEIFEVTAFELPIVNVVPYKKN